MRSLIDPGQALSVGRTVLTAARRAGAAEAVVVALRAMALAARELGDLQAAEHYLRQAIGTTGAPQERLAQARLSLVTVRTERGHPLQALRVAALAWAYLSPLDRAKLDTQRAVALAHLGRYQEAIASCDRSLAALMSAPGSLDDRRFLAGGLLNRGVVNAYRADWDSAMRDIEECLRIAQEAGLDHLARLAAANLPFLAVRRGDVAAAFGHYRAAEETLRGFPERLAAMRADLAGALLAAHLPGEARAMLSLAVPDLEASGSHAALAEARLKLAQVELLTGDARQARQVAEQAARELTEQDRKSWLPLATEVILRARLELEPTTPALLGELIGCADELEDAASCLDGAAALRLAAAEAALALDDHPTASAQLAHLTVHAKRERERWVPAGARLTSLASELQARQLAQASQIPSVVRQHALALEAALQEDITAAFRAVNEGLARVGEQVETFDDPSLRAHAARAGERLAAFGLGLAVRDGCAGEVFEWAERWRAVTAPAHAGEPIEAEQARAALGGSALVEFVTDDDSLLAVVISGTRVLLRRLGALGPINEAVARLRYALRRLSLGDGDGELRPAAEELDRLLLRPLAAELGDRPLVIVPVGLLHTLPWNALPGLRDRPVSVAASASAWLKARVYAFATPAPVVMAAAGPALAHAGEEVERVLACHPGARRLPGRTGAVLAALGQCDVLHLAAHGVFNARSPLLSGITLDDGQLMAYDLLNLARSPRLVALSACDSGLARAPSEGAPLGLAGTFLAHGTACVVAGLVPVRDEAALSVMTAFHELVAAGQAPDAALATASAKTGVPGFVCFGAGDRPVVGRSEADQPVVGRAPADQPVVGRTPANQPVVDLAPADQPVVGRAPADQPVVATGLDGSATQLDHEPT
ncbi:CHAT domain-containing protein [Nonomuraea sp. NN258]|uniref:CHAT domain-containing protein n=1 Tax=Nonomuraea antri TaxID=2730852 RepID=UPI001567FA5E|nr:CHAT domain-containing tetratricopeptide repeat protein [Nonomuraea antri]NRQ31086.1 CHAT domain-containing protein [Nonomuraea antri]